MQMGVSTALEFGGKGLFLRATSSAAADTPGLVTRYIVAPPILLHRFHIAHARALLAI
jgi:hypothetical protein